MADQAVVRVIDAQYGGILPDTASVLIPYTQYTRTGSAVHEGGTTIDVRLERTGAGWAVTALRPGRPGPPAVPLGESARAVLAQPRIELPPAAAADIRSGAVHEGVLRAMLRLADSYRVSVSVVRSGHPANVFGTARPSDHPAGRAFDVWRIDGRPVVDPATPGAWSARSCGRPPPRARTTSEVPYSFRGKRGEPVLLRRHAPRPRTHRFRRLSRPASARG